MAISKHRKKKKTGVRQGRTPAQTWGRLTTIMRKHDHTPIDQRSITDMELSMLSYINALQYGRMGQLEYSKLVQLIILGDELVSILGAHDKSGQVEAQRAAMIKAMGAMDGLAERYIERESFAARGEDLKSLHDCKDSIVALLQLCDVSHAAQAADAAGRRMAQEMV